MLEKRLEVLAQRIYAGEKVDLAKEYLMRPDLVKIVRRVKELKGELPQVHSLRSPKGVLALSLGLGIPTAIAMVGVAGFNEWIPGEIPSILLVLFGISLLFKVFPTTFNREETEQEGDDEDLFEQISHQRKRIKLFLNQYR